MDQEDQIMDNQFYFKNISVVRRQLKAKKAAGNSKKKKTQKRGLLVSDELDEDEPRNFFVFIEFYEHEINLENEIEEKPEFDLCQMTILHSDF